MGRSKSSSQQQQCVPDRLRGSSTEIEYSSESESSGTESVLVYHSDGTSRGYRGKKPSSKKPYSRFRKPPSGSKSPNTCSSDGDGTSPKVYTGPSATFSAAYEACAVPEELRRPLIGHHHPHDRGKGGMHMIIDVESGKRSYFGKCVVAVGICVVQVAARDSYWIVDVVSERLFAMPQDEVEFDEYTYVNFWIPNLRVLKELGDIAKLHNRSYDQVICDIHDWLIYCDVAFGYPQRWSDNMCMDYGLLNMEIARCCQRPSLSHAPILTSAESQQQSENSFIQVAEYEYARRPFCLHTLATTMCGAHYLFAFCVSGSPNFINQALYLHYMGAVKNISGDHNPVNDAVVLAINLGRLLCRQTELQKKAKVAAPIQCFRKGKQVEFGSVVYDPAVDDPNWLVRPVH